jgi:hypothetical protein
MRSSFTVFVCGPVSPDFRQSHAGASGKTGKAAVEHAVAKKNRFLGRRWISGTQNSPDEPVP